MDVTFHQVSKIYNGFTAVKNLNLKIKSGALHFLLGPSGCGKTTTLRMLAGLEKVSSGQIFFGEDDVTHRAAAERGIGMVFQNYALWPHMTVRENIAYGLKLRKASKTATTEAIARVLAMTHLQDVEHRLPGQLSGGQQQRVALARALAITPSVLLLDEPLSNLDAKLRLEMRDNIARIHRETGITTLYVTHDQREALSMGSAITVMQAGEIVQTGTPRELYQNPQSAFLASFIGETNLVAGQIAGCISGDAGKQQWLIDTALGRLVVANKEKQTDTASKDVLLSIRPEAIEVAKASAEIRQPDTNRIKLRLQHLTYLGDSEQMEFVYGKGQALKASLCNAPDHNLTPGQEVSCFVPAAKIVMLPYMPL